MFDSRFQERIKMKYKCILPIRLVPSLDETSFDEGDIADAMCCTHNGLQLHNLTKQGTYYVSADIFPIAFERID